MSNKQIRELESHSAGDRQDILQLKIFNHLAHLTFNASTTPSLHEWGTTWDSPIAVIVSLVMMQLDYSYEFIDKEEILGTI